MNQTINQSTVTVTDTVTDTDHDGEKNRVECAVTERIEQGRARGIRARSIHHLVYFYPFQPASQPASEPTQPARRAVPLSKICTATLGFGAQMCRHHKSMLSAYDPTLHALPCLAPSDANLYRKKGDPVGSIKVVCS